MQLANQYVERFRNPRLDGGCGTVATQVVWLGQIIFVTVVAAWSSTLNAKRGVAPASAGLASDAGAIDVVVAAARVTGNWGYGYKRALLK